jgi:hypothetical protein
MAKASASLPVHNAIPTNYLMMSSKYGEDNVIPGIIKHHAMKMYWEGGGKPPLSLTSTLGGEEWSTSRPHRFIPGKQFAVPTVQEWESNQARE